MLRYGGSGGWYYQLASYVNTVSDVSTKNLLVHLRFTHFFFSSAVPTQFAPPPDGAGLIQSRLRDVVPLPHVLLQDDQVVQWPHCP